VLCLSLYLGLEGHIMQHSDGEELCASLHRILQTMIPIDPVTVVWLDLRKDCE
jgi:hypothetical protein